MVSTTTPLVRSIAGREVPSAGDWEIDPSHSSAEFRVRHLVAAKVRGRFGKLQGTIHIAEVPEESTVEVTIEAASIDTRDEQRDGHLRSPDFLDVEKYPSLTFRSTKVVPVSSDKWKVEGELTIRNVTRPVTLDVEFNGVVLDMEGKERAGFSATTEIDRYDFDLTWNQTLETGGLLVGKQIQIEIEVEAKKL
ncbi:MAG: YceI family protein [Actinobacteria bacterium]|jgi:polyisoprenoid-binding protein YceI|nr:YceI family protein [Actinomycetota bacterium]